MRKSELLKRQEFLNEQKTETNNLHYSFKFNFIYQTKYYLRHIVNPFRIRVINAFINVWLP